MADIGGHAAPASGACEGGGSSGRAPTARPSALPATVLVVDDEPSIRLLCRVNLELDGYEVLEAESLTEARQALADGDLDVVLLDVHLHGERSDAFVLDCHARTPRVPVVVVTGSADVTEERLTEADAILPKPFELGELLGTVRTLAGVHAHR